MQPHTGFLLLLGSQCLVAGTRARVRTHTHTHTHTHTRTRTEAPVTGPVSRVARQVGFQGGR